MDDAIAALATIPLYRDVDPAGLSITRLGGLSNRSFRVAGPAGVDVLRLAGATTDAVVDRRAEAANARAAANQTQWDDLDYLIVDMPPGTGDIQLTLSQQVPVSGAVIVTTPQDIALLDARKGLQMFRKVSVPILGIVENMSTHICSECGHEEPIFGHGGGEQMAADFDVELIGSLPLDLRIREQTDSGTPSVIADPEGANSLAYRQTARRMAALLAIQGKDYSHAFPKIVVEDS